MGGPGLAIKNHSEKGISCIEANAKATRIARSEAPDALVLSSSQIAGGAYIADHPNPP